MKILIWGTGMMARKLIEYGVQAQILGFIQTQKTMDVFMGYPVFLSDEIPDGFDYILVANTYANQVQAVCENLGIDDSKVIYLYRGSKTKYKLPEGLREILGEANMTRYATEYGVLEDTFFYKDCKTYTQMNTRDTFAINDKYLWPITFDKYDSAGTVSNYFWQDLWAARLILKSGVEKHFDIGSRLDGFIAHLLAANIDVTMIDVREFPTEIEGLHTIVDDATYLNNISDESIPSMSALCSLEHFGLGRYGDPVDPEACFKCFDNIQKKLALGANLYISLPIGRERVEFNAHRVFYPSTVISCFDKLKLQEFSVTSQGTITYHADVYAYDDDPHNGDWRYGLFHFVK